MTASIFISYRRRDAIAQASAVFERLRADFGAEQVFIDLDGTDYGEDYVDELNLQLAHCRVMLLLLGPQWLDARDSKSGVDFVYRSTRPRPQAAACDRQLRCWSIESRPPMLGQAARLKALSGPGTAASSCSSKRGRLTLWSHPTS
jgi:TIR domain